MKQLQRFLPLLLIFVLLIAAIRATTMPIDDLPRNMLLKAFDPDRKDFVCKYEADAVPPIDPQADAWFHEGLRLTGPALWSDQRDYPKAVQLWQKAAERHHWKAMLNLADFYAHGEGVERDSEHAVQIVEEAMKLGVPSAYDLMGTYYMNGVGVNQDASRAYAFWQLAADMGSPSAMAYLGRKLRGTYNDPPTVWANRRIAFQMLECGVAQGNGQAALELGVILAGTNKSLGEDSARALKILHEGVKFGSEECANYLFSVFSNGAAMVHSKDPTRAARYSAIGDALRRNPDLRLPNLDKVLPLPPADLPQWNMSEPQTLIDAAKLIVPTPDVEPTPGAQRTGRAHIPQGYALPRHPVPPAAEWQENFERLTAVVHPRLEGAGATFSGYWIAQLTESVREYQQEWNARQEPQRYAKGEALGTVHRDSLGRYADILVVRWHYLGEPVKLPLPPLPVSVARGVARMGRMPAQLVKRWGGGLPCPRTGVWEPWVEDDHPLARVYHEHVRQAYVVKGQPFPDPRQSHLDIEAQHVRWVWIDNANQPAAVGTRITLSDLHDERGRPLA